MKFEYSGVFFLILFAQVDLQLIFGDFIHCELETCSKYDHIIVGRKVDKCTQDLLIKFNTRTTAF